MEGAMKYARPFVLSTAALLVFLSGASSEDKPAIEGPGDASNNWFLRPTLGNESLGGVVTAVSKDAIWVRGIIADIRWAEKRYPGRKCYVYEGKAVMLMTPTQRITGVKIICNSDGYTVTMAQGQEISVRVADQIPRRIQFCRELAEGGVKELHSPANAYRVQDVKVGDCVSVGYDRVNWVETCHSIRIYRRPGGLVPPSPNEPDRVDGVKYHERANTYNDWIDKGIPLPDKFLTPRELEERYAKIAPKPREVKPRIPRAAP